jgi:SAM-dependent methyltransferase
MSSKDPNAGQIPILMCLALLLVLCLTLTGCDKQVSAEPMVVHEQSSETDLVTEFETSMAVMASEALEESKRQTEQQQQQIELLSETNQLLRDLAAALVPVNDPEPEQPPVDDVSFDEPPVPEVQPPPVKTAFDLGTLPIGYRVQVWADNSIAEEVWRQTYEPSFPQLEVFQSGSDLAKQHNIDGFMVLLVNGQAQVVKRYRGLVSPQTIINGAFALQPATVSTNISTTPSVSYQRVQTGTKRVRVKRCQNGRCWYEWVDQPVYENRPVYSSPQTQAIPSVQQETVRPYAIWNGVKYYGRVCNRSWCDMCNDIELQIKNFNQPSSSGSFMFTAAEPADPDFPDGRNPLLSAGEQPLRMAMVRRMLAVANVGAADTHYDAGCGDGRILVEAVRRFGVKHAYGVEINPELAAKAKATVKRLGLSDRITINPDGITDMFDFDPAKYGVTSMTAHHFVDLLAKLKPQLTSVRVAVTTHEVPGLRMTEVDEVYVLRKDEHHVGCTQRNDQQQESHRGYCWADHRRGRSYWTRHAC